MIKSVKRIKPKEENIEKIFREEMTTDLLFREIQKDTIGKSGSNPTWGYVYSNEDGKPKFVGVALYKEHDYDYPKAAYCEKIWSIMGRRVLGDKTRVAEIDVVEEKPGDEEIISYRLMNNDKEDMTHIRDILFIKFERDDIRARKNIFSIEEILESIKLQINDEENYKQIEKAVIHVLLLDSLTNNADRHGLNWGLVRNEKTNKYELAVFDHSSAFIDMIEYKPFSASGIWTSTYINIEDDYKKSNMGSMGHKVVSYIRKAYPEYFEEFYNQFEQSLPDILEEIKAENMKIDFRRLETKLFQKKSFYKKLKDRGELEYE